MLYRIFERSTALNKYFPDIIHRRVDYAQYTFRLAPQAFDGLKFPIAVYGKDGIITGANKYFREVARITQDNIQNRTANLFNLLNNENALLTEAAHNAFDGKEKVYQGIGRALCSEPGTIEYLRLEDYPNAIFFPMAIECGGVTLAGILLDDNKT